tara:strand:- start:701 stop:940 length:240 start_codon:yes stop_codon:yes gene_type:complete
MKDTVENNEIELDTSGTECPIPVLKARKLSQEVPKGTIIKIIATDPLAEADFRHYCEQSKYKFLGIKRNKKKLYIRLKI